MKMTVKHLIWAMTALLVVMFAVSTLAACQQDWQKAEKDAKAYVKKIPGATGEVECAHKDSDGDGYCSCSVFMKDGSITPIDCGCETYCVNCSEGCKVQLPFKAVRDK